MPSVASNQIKERVRIKALFDALEARPLVHFPQSRKPIVAPSVHGVYVVRDPDGIVVHVGRTVRGKAGLAQRLRNHVNAKSSFVRAYLGGSAERLRNGFTFQFIEVPDDRERTLLEHFATAWYCPVHLGLGREGNHE